MSELKRREKIFHSQGKPLDFEPFDYTDAGLLDVLRIIFTNQMIKTRPHMRDRNVAFCIAIIEASDKVNVSEIARRCDISRWRARQILCIAARRIKHPRYKKRLIGAA